MDLMRPKQTNPNKKDMEEISPECQVQMMKLMKEADVGKEWDSTSIDEWNRKWSCFFAMTCYIIMPIISIFIIVLVIIVFIIVVIIVFTFMVKSSFNNHHH